MAGFDEEGFEERVNQQWTRLGFQAFCKLIEEPASFGGKPNVYAEGKWRAWQQLHAGLNNLGHENLKKLLREEE